MTIAFTTFKLGLVKPMGVMTHVAYLVNWKYRAEITSLLIIALHSVINIGQMFMIYSIMGVLSEKMGVTCSALLPHGNINLIYFYLLITGTSCRTLYCNG